MVIIFNINDHSVGKIDGDSKKRGKVQKHDDKAFGIADRGSNLELTNKNHNERYIFNWI